MEFEFQNKNLEELYTKGKNRKYKLQPAVVKKFFMRIQQIEAAKDIHDLWKTPKIMFKYLESEKFYSIRVDGSYRLEMDIEWHNEEKTIGKILIKNLSNHYGD